MSASSGEAKEEEIGIRSNLTRRSLVLGGVGVASMLAVGGAAVFLIGDRPLLRPPGGQDEDRLWGACIKCDRCRSACPTNVVDVAHLEEGLVNARTPKMGFRKGYCDFCKDREAFRCVDSCPTGALALGFDPYQDKIGMAYVDTDECLLYRSGSHRCPRPCVDACEFDALIYDAATNRLTVVEEKCNGCGACEYVCISSSYGSYTGSGKRGINVDVWGEDAS